MMLATIIVVGAAVGSATVSRVFMAVSVEVSTCPLLICFWRWGDILIIHIVDCAIPSVLPAGAKIIALDQRRVGLGARGAERYGVSASPSSYKQRDDRRGGGGGQRGALLGDIRWKERTEREHGERGDRPRERPRRARRAPWRARRFGLLHPQIAKKGRTPQNGRGRYRSAQKDRARGRRHQQRQEFHATDRSARESRP